MFSENFAPVLLCDCLLEISEILGLVLILFYSSHVFDFADHNDLVWAKGNRDMTEIHKITSNMVMMNEECLFSIPHYIPIIFKEHEMKLPDSWFKANKWNTFPCILQS